MPQEEKKAFVEKVLKQVILDYVADGDEIVEMRSLASDETNDDLATFDPYVNAYFLDPISNMMTPKASN